jgi:hypothetical protein
VNLSLSVVNSYKEELQGIMGIGEEVVGSDKVGGVGGKLKK